MTEAERNIYFRTMYDTARYVSQDCEAYNSTNEKEYLQSIIKGAKTVNCLAKLLLESDTE